MIYSKTVHKLILAAFFSTVLWGQQGTEPGREPEFPLVLQQSVTAGKTQVGSKIEAKLLIATLAQGRVIPRNATFSGEVTESVAKTATAPSRLAIRMDSAQWKEGSASIKLFLTGWYYPTINEAGQDLQYGPPEPANRTWNGQGQYPDPNSKVYRPFPGDDSDKKSSVPVTPTSAASNHRVRMKDVETERSTDGTVSLTSKKSNVKLERYTTYVLSASEVMAQK